MLMLPCIMVHYLFISYLLQTMTQNQNYKNAHGSTFIQNSIFIVEMKNRPTSLKHVLSWFVESVLFFKILHNILLINIFYLMSEINILNPQIKQAFMKKKKLKGFHAKRNKFCLKVTRIILNQYWTENQ